MPREERGGGWMAFLAGAAVGAGLGILLAPKSGEETREQLVQWLKERRQRGSELLNRIKEVVPEKKEQVAAAVKAGKEAFYQTGKHNHEKEAVRS